MNAGSDGSSPLVSVRWHERCFAIAAMSTECVIYKAVSGQQHKESLCMCEGVWPLL